MHTNARMSDTETAGTRSGRKKNTIRAMIGIATGVSTQHAITTRTGAGVTNSTTIMATTGDGTNQNTTPAGMPRDMTVAIMAV